MANAKPIEVLFAVLLLLILAVVIILAFYYNVRGASYDTRYTVIGSFKLINQKLGIKYTPSYLPKKDEKGFTVPEYSYSDSYNYGSSNNYQSSSSPYTYLGKRLCNDPTGKDCPYTPGNLPSPPSNPNCLFKDEYSYLCKYI